MRPVRSMTLLLVLALTAAACGGRVSQEQVIAEAAADGRLGGSGGSLEPGDAGGFTFDDEGNLVEGPTGVAGGTGRTSSGSGRTGGSAATSGSGSGGGGGGGGGGAPAPPGGNGGATDIGVTADKIAIGNVSTLSGPVPGLFKGALVGTQAYFAYVNSQGGLYGRRFEVRSGDDGLDNSKNRTAHENLHDKVFAFVGSFSTNDAASADQLGQWGVPDIGRELSRKRGSLPNHFSPVPLEVQWVTTGAEYLKGRFGADVVANAAMLWSDVEAAEENAQWFMNAARTVGWNFTYTRAVAANELNFTGDIVEMRRRGVQAVVFLGDVGNQSRLWADMHEQNFRPPLKYSIATAYDSSFMTLVGSKEAAEGTIISQNLVMYMGEDAGQLPEIRTYLEWMKRIDPNQVIDLFSFYGWVSAKLFVHAAREVGPQLTRDKLKAYLSNLHEWDAGGLHLPVDVGGKRTLGPCELYMEIKDGRFVRVRPAQGFDCSGKVVPYQG